MRPCALISHRYHSVAQGLARLLKCDFATMDRPLSNLNSNWQRLPNVSLFVSLWNSSIAFCCGVACSVEFWFLFWMSPNNVSNPQWLELQPIAGFQNHALHTFPIISSMWNCFVHQVSSNLLFMIHKLWVMNHDSWWFHVFSQNWILGQESCWLSFKWFISRVCFLLISRSKHGRMDS